MDAMRGSVSENEMEMNVVKKLQNKAGSKRQLFSEGVGDTEMNSNMGDADDKEIPYHALIKESLLLTDSEVTIYFMKFMVGIAIMNFPAQSAHHGVFNGTLSTLLIMAVILKSNENLVKSIPLDLMN